MRTTVRLPDELMRAAKRRAQETARSEPLATYLGQGLRGGVDLSDSSALEDRMTGAARPSITLDT